MVCGCCCWFGGAGCGTSASRPFGVSGVITMKIMIRTNRISISGTTFIVAISPPLFPPTSIPIVVAPLFDVPRPDRIGADAMQIGHREARTLFWRAPNNARSLKPRFQENLVSGRRRWSEPAVLLGLVGQQADVIHTRGTNFVHHF